MNAQRTTSQLTAIQRFRTAIANAKRPATPVATKATTEVNYPVNLSDRWHVAGNGTVYATGKVREQVRIMVKQIKSTGVVCKLVDATK